MLRIFLDTCRIDIYCITDRSLLVTLKRSGKTSVVKCRLPFRPARYPTQKCQLEQS
jgi:hypothetical protein